MEIFAKASCWSRQRRLQCVYNQSVRRQGVHKAVSLPDRGRRGPRVLRARPRTPRKGSGMT